jgi:hypothetical protein
MDQLLNAVGIIIEPWIIDNDIPMYDEGSDESGCFDFINSTNLELG